jgi:hypothetical protein
LPPGPDTSAATEHPEALLESLRGLTDDELVARVKGLGARERRATALLVAHLVELDTRDFCLRAGYPSLFTYCLEALALSEDEAYNRIEAARAARRFPVVLQLLGAGEVSLTAVRLLGRQLTPENHRGVLESARGQRKTEVERIVAALAPRPDVPASVRKLPPRRLAPAEPNLLEFCPPGAASRGLETAAGTDRSVVNAVGSVSVPGRHEVPSWTGSAPGDIPRPSPPNADVRLTGSSNGSAFTAPTPRPSCRPAMVRPLSPDRYKYQLTIGSATLEKLRLAKDMLRHALPSGDDEAILDRALTALLEELARQKFGARRTARAGEPVFGTAPA